MGKSWNQVKRYSKTGWKNSSTRLFFFITSVLTAVLVFLGFIWGQKPFWIALSSAIPILLIYFPLLGFLLELLEKDWDDWHPW